MLIAIEQFIKSILDKKRGNRLYSISLFLGKIANNRYLLIYLIVTSKVKGVIYINKRPLRDGWS